MRRAPFKGLQYLYTCAPEQIWQRVARLLCKEPSQKLYKLQVTSQKLYKLQVTSQKLFAPEFLLKQNQGEALSDHRLTV